MRLKLLSIIGAASLLYGADVAYYSTANHAYTLQKNKKEIIFEYQKLNDTIDVFNLKESEHISSSFDAIGDMDGYKFSFAYGYRDNLTLLADIERQNIEYGSGSLINYYFNIASRYNFYKNEKSFASLDLGIKINKGEDISFSNPDYLASLAKKFLNVKNVKISGNTIGVEKNDGSTEFLNLKNPPSIGISNMKDNSLYFTLNGEKAFNRLLIDIFTTVKYTEIDTDIKANLTPANNDTKNALSKYDLSKNLNRNETSIDLGFNISYKAPVIVEFSYLYRKIFRDKGLDYVDYNHIINLNLIKPVNKKWFVYLGGKAMYRQFNGEIPYLYNRYSQTTFDHKYGWADIGVGYIF